MQDLTQILTQFQEFVSPNFCNAMAKKTRFVQRSTSKIQGWEFAQAMMVPNAFLEAETLNSLGVRMKKINQKCELSASALAQRMHTKEAHNFMKACFGKVLKEVVKRELSAVSDLENLNGFNRILIEDSTRAELHERLSPHFKGSGGVASKASVKIDYVFDYLSEQFIHIDFFSGNVPDQSLANNLLPMLEEGDLVIRDLGYFVAGNFQKIEEQGAYFISRWKVNEHVLISKEATEPIDLKRFLEERMVNGIVDEEVFIGKERYRVRLLASLVDEEGLRKRYLASNRSAKRHMTQISKKKVDLLGYSIFITNIPYEMLSSIAVMATYRMRWRIELIFKQWKSCLKVHMFKGYNKERFHCLLYGRLIMILLLAALTPPLMKYARGLGRELSCYKLTNYVLADHLLAKHIQEDDIDAFVEQLLEDLPRRLCMDKRKRSSLRKNIRMGNYYGNNLKMRTLSKKAA